MSTTIGQVLEEFFSPWSAPNLWVMPETDKYTQIVRSWQPVINAVDQAKANLRANCSTWSASRGTTPTWAPTMTDPPVTDPNAYRVFVPNPPGTAPAWCALALDTYVAAKVASKAARTVSTLPVPGSARIPTPTIQAVELYKCSIGSFNIYATADSVDCARQTAVLNVWMFNAMSQKSFGWFTHDPVFALSGMAKQYMWWNWREGYSWGSAPIPTPTESGGSWSWSGSSTWW